MKNEDKIKELEEQYQTIVRASIDGFWLTDMQGHFQEVNEATAGWSVMAATNC